MTKTYAPKPIDTEHIELSNDLKALGEILARNTHENFVQLRLQEGWTYGPFRDDLKKTNPTLVPFDELSSEEQAYDYKTSSETIKALIALGYRIIRPT